MILTTLKYLFDVEFIDGETYTQNPEDISLKEGNKSCFYDILEMIKEGKKVKTFLLSDGQDSYSVDCADGHFEVNGLPFKFHNEQFEEFELVFFRKHRQNLKPFTNEAWEDPVIYRIGWKTKDKDGKEIERVMEII